MAWYDKPTDGQTGALIREYEPYLLKELDRAKETGAVIKQEAIQAAIDDDVVTKAVKLMAVTNNRGFFSRMIEQSERMYIIAEPVKAAIDSYLHQYGVELDYEWVRQQWREAREAAWQRIQQRKVNRET